MTSANRLRHYPEARAGGFSRVDATIEYYLRVQSILPPSATILEFGAGRGANIIEDSVPFRRDLRNLAGRGHRLVGVDIDPTVLENPYLDEAHVISGREPLPFPDATFDAIVSDAVFEHVDDPDWVAREFARVLKPGGWVCARTPNKWSPVGIAIRLVPNRHHVAVLSRVQKDRKAVDVFPTRYRLNSVWQIARQFPASGWVNATYTTESEPAYVGDIGLLWWPMRLMFHLTPRSFRTNLLIFLQKRPIS